jgi:nitrogen fixation-related uncharacterized protein
MVNDMGELEARLAATIPALIVPGVVILGHLFWALHVLELL